jgi:hypothetical protein
MRRRPVLIVAGLAGLLALTTALVAILLRGWDDEPSRGDASRSGLVSLRSNGSGATLVLSGLVTPDTFKVQSVRVEASRPAGRSSDPDQFRATLLDSDGREIDIVRMWSPLTRLAWSNDGKHQLETLTARPVDLSIPASAGLDVVVLGWTNGKEVARISVGREVRAFCASAPQNPAC